MSNSRKFFILAILMIVIGYSCRPDSVSVAEDNFDHAAQALRDNDTLLKFFETHYYDETIDSVQPLVTGETALIDDARLLEIDVNEFDIDYKLYVFKLREGNPNPVKGFPTLVDSVLVKYRGEYLAKTDSLVFFDQRVITPGWLTLNAVIRGWAHGFVNFKGGRNVTTNGPIEYEDGGKGVLFIPSGLAYRNSGTVGVPSSVSLMFYIDLFDIIEDTDHDRDGVPSIFEDPDGDGNPLNDDTDGNNVPNFLDIDDDGDFIPTINEDENGDGDPSNDFNDPNNPLLPDYLNPDISVNHN